LIAVAAIDPDAVRSHSVLKLVDTTGIAFSERWRIDFTTNIAIQARNVVDVSAEISPTFSPAPIESTNASRLRWE